MRFWKQEAAGWSDSPSRIEKWLQLLLRVNRLSVADLYRVRMLLQLQSGDQSAIRNWQWPRNGSPSEPQALLFSLLLAHLRGANVRLRLQNLSPVFERLLADCLDEEKIKKQNPLWGREEADQAAILNEIKTLREEFLPLAGLLPAFERGEELLQLPRLPILEQNGALYFSSYHAAEVRLIKHFKERLLQPNIWDGAAAVLEALPQAENFDLHQNQKEAIVNSTQRQTSLITGGPGTGKTTVVAQILRLLIRIDSRFESDKVALVAPTGRAAARLTESLRIQLKALPSEPDLLLQQLERSLLQISGSTIHRLLQYNSSNASFYYNSSNHLPHRLVVVDESSMIDIKLFASLLDALRPDCQLILIGDPNQLPPVSAGAILGDLTQNDPIESDNDNFLNTLSGNKEIQEQLQKFATPLTKSHRSAREILELAEKINRREWGSAIAQLEQHRLSLAEAETLWGSSTESGKGGQLLSLDYDDSWTTRWKERFYGDSLHELLDSWSEAARLHFEKSSPIAAHRKVPRTIDSSCGDLHNIALALSESLTKGQILTPVREGDRGVEQLNQQFEQLCRGLRPNRSHATAPFHGQPIIILQNNYHLNIFNGDTGFLLQFGGQLFFLKDRPDELFELISVDQLPRWESAYALTIHKSQGSEYGEVLLILPEQHHRLLEKRLIYTAITRAKKRVTVMGDLQLLQLDDRRSRS